MPIKQVSIPNSEVRTIASSYVDQEFSIFVALPRSYAEPGKSYPVLYVLDANGEFGIATETVRLLGFEEEIPEVIVVGIGYPVEGFFGASGLRARDLTPTEDREWEETFPEEYPKFLPPVRTGRASDFLQFIRLELIPFIEKGYRVHHDRTLVGHSFGGLFALCTLFHYPDTFGRYIIGSPAIWWDKEIVLKYEEDFAALNADLSAQLFLSVGSLEEPVEAPGRFAMVTNVNRLAKALHERAYDSLRMTIEVLENERHFSVVPTTVSKGLRAVFRKVSATRELDLGNQPVCSSL